MKPPVAKRLALLGGAVSLLLAAGLAAGVWFYFQIRASLPRLDGTVRLAGLGAPATAARDALGVPVIRGRTRLDVVRTLGFLHAQERFFQMDLLRRRSAGELAELFGKAALPMDRSTRVHGFRKLAAVVVQRLPADERAILDAYAAGVNAGLAALRQKPFEYLALRTDPQPWRPEDSILILYSMTLDLQDSTGTYELSLATLRDRFGFAGVAFFAPLETPADAALDGSTGALGPVPSASVINLRSEAVTLHRPTIPAPAPVLAPMRDPEALPGSNSFALAGAHTASGVPLLANDPHLDLAVPLIWYRASLSWSEPGDVTVTGVTLPGFPIVVIGSNGHVAWGLTTAYADVGDIVVVEINAIDHSLYKLPGHDELIPIEKRKEVIRVKGGAAETIEVPWTHWGPVIGTNSRLRPLAYHWLPHDPAATNLYCIHLAEAKTVAEAIDVAHHSGVPAQNFLVVDRAGQIGWTIIGPLPKRVGFDGRLPTTWSFGDRRWDGLVPPDEIPTVIAPPGGRLWTANNRPLGGPALALLGDGGYANPPRATQIRDDLAALEQATPADLRAIQLDDRAIFLGPWQRRLLSVLTPEAVAQKRSRGELRQLVEHWEGRAAVDSVSYRLVRAFRLKVAELVFTPIFADCLDQQPSFDWRRFHYEAPLETLLQEQPMHLLSPHYAGWNDLLLAAADAVVSDLDRQGEDLAHATWGRRNTARILHPFGRMLPRWIAGWLNRPATPLPGDVDMPRVQTPYFGASMRMVVSPGREQEGLLHMAGGQSGNPLSPYYEAGYEAWVKGEPTPFLPGPAVHTLQFTP
ncbi:MAG: penicillin acylase family protein [Verrucomicrobia bacterium]|nr:penicillin acylase family protein [Verrucomicrobiota bacterium]